MTIERTIIAALATAIGAVLSELARVDWASYLGSLF